MWDRSSILLFIELTQILGKKMVLKCVFPDIEVQEVGYSQ